MKYFTIYGERCSGTNFLECAVKENFNIEFTAKYTWKHFFGHYNFENTDEENDTLFIGIVREPLSWIDSFWNKKHHIPPNNKTNIHKFLFNQFYSIYDNSNEEIMEDRNIYTKERYKNIFEMRKTKLNFLINDMKHKVKHYILIRYEDLRDNYEVVLNLLKNKFNLEQKYQFYKKIDNYKGKQNKPFIKKLITLKPNIINNIMENLDKEQEKTIGYFN